MCVLSCRVAEMAISDAAPTPQMVGNAFVEQYYSILHQDPDQVHRFYHETSVLSRPEEDGTMTMVTTITVSASNGLNSVITQTCTKYTSAYTVILNYYDFPCHELQMLNISKLHFSD